MKPNSITVLVALLFVLGLSACSGSSSSVPAADRTAPSVPSGLLVTDTTQTSISLAWNASTDDVAVTGYTIIKNGFPISASPENSFVDTGLPSGTIYVYAVSAYDAAGNNSAPSESIFVTTMPTGTGG